jgi:hypothetical protein
MTDQSHSQTQTSTSTTTGVFALLRAKPGVTRRAGHGRDACRDTRDGPTLS